MAHRRAGSLRFGSLAASPTRAHCRRHLPYCLRRFLLGHVSGRPAQQDPKEINKELSRKLEIQTQRLELLTAQSMVNENISTKQPDSRAMYENTQYADEGDEVVERVLGWLMKLFPGGPSRRRTSKLL